MGERLVRDKANLIWPDYTYRPVRNLYEHRRFLMQKILEEAAELVTAERADELKEEAGDLLEAIAGFLALEEISLQEVDEVRERKFQERGGFIDGLVWTY